MSNVVQEFNDYRSKMNEVILSKDNLVIKRLFNFPSAVSKLTTKRLRSKPGILRLMHMLLMSLYSMSETAE